jgi:hypothetical protein
MLSSHKPGHSICNFHRVFPGFIAFLRGPILLPTFVAPGHRILLFSTVMFALGSLAYAQDITSGTRREEVNRPAKTTKPTSTTVTRTRTVYITKNAHPTVTTGTLAVGALPNATVRLDPVKGGEALEGKLPPTEKVFIFPPLKPGTYRLTAELEGHRSASQTIQIVANKNKPVTLDLAPILYTIRINTNVASGEVRYAPVEPYMEGGEKKYKPIGATRLAPIENRSAVLPALNKGTYGVDIRSTEPGYEDKLVSITVPDDSNKEEINVDVALKFIRSTADFSGITSDQWDLPPGWSIDSYVLSTNGKGIAIPHAESNRHYTDFQLISDVRMVNGVAASFVVRASTNLENYYLIQLTGANAEEPFWLSGYVVTNATRERLLSLPVKHLSTTLETNKDFRVSIKVKDNNIEVGIIDSETGKYFALGGLTDPNRRFSIGAVGIYSGDKEQNKFGTFNICSPECPH